MTKMRYLTVLAVLLSTLHVVEFAPVVPDKREKLENKSAAQEDLVNGLQTGLEYEKYLEQVIKVLESDPEMKSKLESMSIDDLKTGKVASDVNLLDHNIRSQLDELKRLEIQRLRMVARKKMENGANAKNIDSKFVDNLIGHIDPIDTNSFGPKDLENLMKKATKDLEEADRMRREDFKKYEMEKEIQRRRSLEDMDELKRQEAKKQYEEQRKDEREKHKQLKHPGSRAQLEDVWERTDHLERDQFNPKTFFALHDTNGDKVLDSFELEALFFKEVEDVYKSSNADPREKFEEIARMREHVVKEVDLDKDGLVSMQEFIDAAQRQDFDTDEGWDDDIDQDLYTEEELEEYRQAMKEVVQEKKEKLKKEQDDYMKRRVEAGAGGEPVMQNQERIKELASEAADEIQQKFREKQHEKLQVQPQPPPGPDAQQAQVDAGRRAAEVLAAQQAAQQQAAQQAAQQQVAQQQAAQQQVAQQQAAQQQASQVAQQAAQLAAQKVAQAAGQQVPQDPQQVPVQAP